MSDTIDQAACPAADLVSRLRDAREWCHRSSWESISEMEADLEPLLGHAAFVLSQQSAELERLKAERTALAVLPQSSGGWHPIETAPKDGTIILVWNGRWFLFAEYATFANPEQSGWYEADAPVGGKLTPTHWQPLIPPHSPTEQKGGADEEQRELARSLREMRREG